MNSQALNGQEDCRLKSSTMNLQQIEQQYNDQTEYLDLPSLDGQNEPASHVLEFATSLPSFSLANR